MYYTCCCAKCCSAHYLGIFFFRLFDHHRPRRRRRPLRTPVHFHMLHSGINGHKFCMRSVGCFWFHFLVNSPETRDSNERRNRRKKNTAFVSIVLLRSSTPAIPNRNSIDGMRETAYAEPFFFLFALTRVFVAGEYRSIVMLMLIEI